MKETTGDFDYNKYNFHPKYYDQGQVPHTCPVCNGRGTLPWNFYNPDCTATTSIECKSCLGTGILWR